MPLSQQVANWLFNVLQPQYVHKQVAYNHLYQFLLVHLKRNLRFRIRTQVYTSSDVGNSELLINLFGSIVTPLAEVPVEIWVPLNYPYGEGVPMVYIIPDHARELYLRPGNHVDTQGRFYHPYLASWFYECNSEATLGKYNLLELIKVIEAIVILDTPIQKRVPQPQSGPEIPPKPAKVPITNGMHYTPVISPQVLGQPNTIDESYQVDNPHSTHTISGPPIPSKPLNSSIPLKYQKPLPLPVPPNEAQSEPQIQQNYTGNGYQGYNQEQRIYHQTTGEYSQTPTHTSPQRTPPIYKSQRVKSPPKTSLKSPVKAHAKSPENSSIKSQTSPIDLMDENVPSTIPQTLHRELLEQLSTKINEYLQKDDNNLIQEVNENSVKFGALYNQLNHHYSQAIANSRHLDDHMNYLSQQLLQITKLNQDLVALDQLNNSQLDKVYTSATTSIALDDLIIPDLPLVKQLYDVVLEIKAIKDTISLIGGGFDTQSELINDSNMDMCVKTVRNLGRELFWLELTKNEIANLMTLH